MDCGMKEKVSFITIFGSHSTSIIFLKNRNVQAVKACHFFFLTINSSSTDTTRAKLQNFGRVTDLPQYNITIFESQTSADKLFT